MSIGRSTGAGAGSVAAGVEGAEERAQAVRAEERSKGLRPGAVIDIHQDKGNIKHRRLFNKTIQNI